MNPFNPHNNSENIYDFYFTHDETEIQRHCITRLRLQILSGKGRFQAHLVDFQSHYVSFLRLPQQITTSMMA